MKKFNGNPALSFISRGKEEPEKINKDPEKEETTPVKEVEEKPKEKAAVLPKTAADASPAENEPAYKRKAVKAEAKSKRVNLVIQPSLYNTAKKKTKKEGKSFNQYIIDLIIKDLG